MATKTKGTKLDGMGRIIRTGTSCVGNMSWETPYVIFEYDGVEYRWQSESVSEDLLDVSDSVYLEAFAYGDRLKRVRVTRMFLDGSIKIYGMKL